LRREKKGEKKKSCGIRLEIAIANNKKRGKNFSDKSEKGYEKKEKTVRQRAKKSRATISNLRKEGGSAQMGTTKTVRMKLQKKRRN